MVDQKIDQTSDESFEFEQALKACQPNSTSQSVGEIMFAAGLAVQHQNADSCAVPTKRQPGMLAWQMATAASTLIAIVSLGALAWQSNNTVQNPAGHMANSTLHEPGDQNRIVNNQSVAEWPIVDEAIATELSQFVNAVWLPKSADLYSPLGRRRRMIKLASQESFVDFESRPIPPVQSTLPSNARQLIEQFSNSESL